MTVTPTGWLQERQREEERLDAPLSWGDYLEENLRELAWTNRWFGGTSSICAALKPLLPATAARLLDVGTANGATLAAVGRWAEQRGARWSLHGLDLSPTLLDLAGPHPPFSRCAGDALELPFADDTFDAVISLQTLHHFDDAPALSVVREMMRVSRGYVVISDLRRSLVTYVAARGLAALVWRNAVTRHDGPMSVRSAFTPRELRTLATRAGAQGFRVRTHGPFRLVVEWNKNPGSRR